MKKCSLCCEDKDEDSFYKSGKYLSAKCKPCTKDHVNNYRIQNKEVISERKKKYRIANFQEISRKNKERYEADKDRVKTVLKTYYENNKESLNAANRLYYHKNRDRMREGFAKWRKSNLDKKRAMNAKRRAAKLMAIPSWADMKEISKIYKDAQRLSGMHVDHIVPLQSKLVCGLHVSNNLQIISAIENSKKSNYIWPDMP